MPRALPLLAFIALLAACDRPGDLAKSREVAGRALRGSLTYPNSGIVSISAGDEAAELVMSSADSVKVVADWFRRALPLNGWAIKSDVRTQLNEVTIYAEQRNRPLWITLRPSGSGVGTTYTLVGAVMPGDTSKTLGR